MGTIKQEWGGTHRTRPVEQTLDIVRPLASAAGVTRLANITGLDTLGIPVFVAVRPNSRSLSTSQGKGVSATAAKVSALCEAIECYHAEHPHIPVILESAIAMRRRYRIPDCSALPLRKDTAYTEARPIPWACGIDLETRDRTWVPFELVHMNSTIPRIPGSGCFVAGSNGLASGNCIEEALLHATCELIERDAMALWHRGGPVHWAATRIHGNQFEDAQCSLLGERIQQAGAQLHLWNVTSDTGVPAFSALIAEESSVLRPMPVAFGSGCHPDRRIALSRAISEAAQSRATVIAGTRDDLTDERYRTLLSPQISGAHRLLMSAGVGRESRVDTVPSLSSGDIATDLSTVAARLRSIGLPEIICVDLSQDTKDLCIVRVIVPGLEGPSESPLYAPGARMRRWLSESVHLCRSDN